MLEWFPSTVFAYVNVNVNNLMEFDSMQEAFLIWHTQKETDLERENLSGSNLNQNAYI